MRISPRSQVHHDDGDAHAHRWCRVANLSIRAMRAVPSAAFTRDLVPFGGVAELRSSYVGYFGTHVIAADSTVVHRVTCGTIPSYVGTDQRRNYRFRGDTLSINADEP